MSTRSTINVKTAKGIKSIYCHWDGYPSHQLPILTEAYNSQKLAESLVKHGNLSFLERKNNKPKGHTFETPVKDHCVYYGRDRGEEDQEYILVSDLSTIRREEYTYVWDGSAWYVEESE